MTSLTLFFALLMVAAPHAVTTLDVRDDHRIVAQSVEWLEDSQGSMAPADVMRPETSAAFTRWTKRGDVNFGISRSTYWLRLAVQRTARAPKEWVLVVNGRPLQSLQIFDPEGPARSSAAVRQLPAYPRQSVTPLSLDIRPRFVYLRVQSTHAVTIPLAIWRESAYATRSQLIFLIEVLYYGGALTIVLIYLLLFTSMRDDRYLLYALFATAMATGIFMQNGMGSALFWPEHRLLDIILSMICFALTGATGIRFARRCLTPARFAPRIDHVLTWLTWAFVALAALVVVTAAGYMNTTVLGLLFILSVSTAGVLVPYVAVLAWRAHVQSSGYFFVAFSAVWTGSIVAGLRSVGVLPTSDLTMSAMQIGAGFDMLVLAVALTDIVRAERATRQLELDATLQAQRQMVVLLSASEERLTRAVHERTAELQTAVEKESATLQRYMKFGELVSHEFRNPLGVILGQVAVLRRTHPDVSAELTQRLDMVHGATRRLSSLFDAWLEGDNVEHASTRFLPQRLPIERWIHERVEEHAHLAHQHRVVVRVAPEVHMIVADPHLLEMALSNLLVNAFKYAPSNSTVHVTVSLNEEEIGIAVMDEGAVIPAEMHDRIFEAYVRGTPDTSIPGLGLGLYTVRRAVEAHGGRVTLEAREHGGNVFCLRLPAPPTSWTPSGVEAIHA